jgi:hypothetical protein
LKRCALFLSVALAALGAWVGSAGAAITATEGADTVVTPRFELDFGNVGGNVEWLQGVKWRPSTAAVFGANLSAAAGSGCGGDATEFWGQSYGNADGQGPGPVVAGNRGSWDRRGGRTVEIDTIASEACSGDTPPVPVRTRYSFFDEGASANAIRMERSWSFSPTQEAYSVQGMRALVPRLPYPIYNQEIYPDGAGNLATTGLCNVCLIPGSGWNGKWVALDSSTTHAGLMIIRAAGNASPASLTLDYDGSSGSNNTGISLDRPVPNGWLAPVTETEFLCFYDVTTWPLAERSANRLPDGCAEATVPVNTQPPALSAGAGNPRLGEKFFASPGKWDFATGAFAYQWSRCLEDVCEPISEVTGTEYTATGADVGHQLKVMVTATAAGGETDVAESNVAGAISGHVYEGSQKGPTVGGAGVQVCRRRGTPCRTTTTNGSGFYRVQAPLVGKYRVTAFPPPGSNAVSRTRGTITRVKAETEATEQDVALGVSKPPPPNVDFSGSGVRAKSAEGVPVVHWQEPFEIEYETDIDYEVEARVEFPDGQQLRVDPEHPVEPSPENAENGIFVFSIPPLAPNHGAARVTIVVNVPRVESELEEEEAEQEEEEAEEEEESEEEDEEEDENEEEDEEPEEDEESEEEEDEEEEQEEDEEQEEEQQEEDEENEEEGPGPEPGNPEETTFPIYIDPSGFVRTVDGAPLPGATVTLFQSQTKNGSFTVVPDGSAVMSPMNRVNPDHSEADGHFGWDVIAGFYKVRVEKPGCHLPGDTGNPFRETGVMTIPPPVTNLDLRLQCDPPATPAAGPPPSRVRPRVSLRLPAGATIKVDKKGRVKFKSAAVDCPAAAEGPCSANILLTAAPPNKKAARGSKAKAVKIGRGRLSIAAGASAVVEAKLTKAALAQLSKLKRLKATVSVTATVPGGDGGAGSFRATLKAPTKK